MPKKIVFLLMIFCLVFSTSFTYAATTVQSESEIWQEAFRADSNTIHDYTSVGTSSEYNTGGKEVVDRFLIGWTSVSENGQSWGKAENIEAENYYKNIKDKEGYELIYYTVPDYSLVCNNGFSATGLTYLYVVKASEPEENCVHKTSCYTCGGTNGNHVKTHIPTSNIELTCSLCKREYSRPNCVHFITCKGCGNLPNQGHGDNIPQPDIKEVCTYCKGEVSFPNCKPNDGDPHDHPCINCGEVDGHIPGNVPTDPQPEYCEECEEEIPFPNCEPGSIPSHDHPCVNCGYIIGHAPGNTPTADTYQYCSDCKDVANYPNCTSAVACVDTTSTHVCNINSTPSKAPEVETQNLFAELVDNTHVYKKGESFSLKGKFHIITTTTYEYLKNYKACGETITTSCNQGISSHESTTYCTVDIGDYGDSPRKNETVDAHSAKVTFSGFTANGRNEISIPYNGDKTWELLGLQITNIDKDNLQRDEKGPYGTITVKCENNDNRVYTFKIYFNFFDCHEEGICKGGYGDHKPATYSEHPINNYKAKGAKKVCDYCGEIYYIDVNCNKSGSGSSLCHVNDICDRHKATYEAHPINGYIGTYGTKKVCVTCKQVYYEDVSCSNNPSGCNHPETCDGGDGNHPPESIDAHPINGYEIDDSEIIKDYCPVCDQEYYRNIKCTKNEKTLTIKSIRDLRWQNFFTKNNQYANPLYLIVPNNPSDVLLRDGAFSSKNEQPKPDYGDYPLIGMGYAVEYETSFINPETDSSYLSVTATLYRENGTKISYDEIYDGITGIKVPETYFKFNSRDNKDNFTLIKEYDTEAGKLKTYSFLFRVPPKIVDASGKKLSNNRIDVKFDIELKQGNKIIQTYSEYLKNLEYNWNGKVFSYSTNRSLLIDLDNNLTY